MDFLIENLSSLGRQSCSSIPFRVQIGELILNNTVQWRYHKENSARHLAVLRVSVSETLVNIRLLPNPIGNTARTSRPEYSSLTACSCSLLRLRSKELSFSIKKSNDLKYTISKTHLHCTCFTSGFFTQSWHDATLGIILHNLFTSNKEIRLLANGNSWYPEAVYLKNKPRLVPVCVQAFSSRPLSPFSSQLASLTDSFSQLCHLFLSS